MIIEDNVDFLSGTLTSAEAPAVSTIAKENKVVFVALTAKTMLLTTPQNLSSITRLYEPTECVLRTLPELLACAGFHTD